MTGRNRGVRECRHAAGAIAEPVRHPVARLAVFLRTAGNFPFIAKKISALLHACRVYAKWQRARTFDRNLIVIGASAAGLVSAYIGAAVKAKVRAAISKSKGAI